MLPSMRDNVTSLPVIYAILCGHACRAHTHSLDIAPGVSLVGFPNVIMQAKKPWWHGPASPKQLAFLALLAATSFVSEYSMEA